MIKRSKIMDNGVDLAIQTDITIVGGALAGAALALALAKQTQWHITLVTGGALEKMPASSKVLNSRVVALNDASLEFLATLGVHPLEAVQHACPYRKMAVWDGSGLGEVIFDAADSHKPFLGLITENNALVAELHRALQAEPQVDVIAERRVDELQAGEHGGSVIRLDSGERIKTQLVVAADGARSNLRDYAGIPTAEAAYGHNAIVATVQVSQNAQGMALQRFSQDGPLAFLPLPSIENKHYCAVVWSLKETIARTYFAQDDVQFSVTLERPIESRLGQVLAVHHKAMIPLVERHATQYFNQGVVLIGDAAHTLHPLAGQGVNLGFADVAALTAELVRAERRALAVNEPSVFARYQRNRKMHNAAAIKAMAAFKLLFEQPSPYLGLVRNQGMQWFNKSRWLKKQAMQLASGLL